MVREAAGACLSGGIVMAYMLRRVASIIPVLFLTSVLVFLFLHAIPGDPAEVIAGPGAPMEEVERIRDVMGLNKPIISQYLTWMSDISQGNFGKSFINGEEIGPIVWERFKNTLALSTFGILFAVLIGVPLGILAATHQNSFFDVFVMMISIVGISMPIFWIGLILIIVFAVNLGLLPATGSGGFEHLILPGIAIGANSLAVIARMTRSSMLEVLRQDYVTTAESKGLPARTVIWKHCLRNALIPIVTTIGIQFGYLMGGAVLTESVFVYPGIGRLLVESIKRRDFPVVQVCVLFIAAMFIVVNLIVDLLYSWLDPKIKYQAQG